MPHTASKSDQVAEFLARRVSSQIKNISVCIDQEMREFGVMYSGDALWRLSQIRDELAALSELTSGFVRQLDQIGEVERAIDALAAPMDRRRPAAQPAHDPYIS
jgi:thioredoxin-like negative regulator of GroEL